MIQLMKKVDEGEEEKEEKKIMMRGGKRER